MICLAFLWGKWRSRRSRATVSVFDLLCRHHDCFFYMQQVVHLCSSVVSRQAGSSRARSGQFGRPSKFMRGQALGRGSPFLCAHAAWTADDGASMADAATPGALTARAFENSGRTLSGKAETFWTVQVPRDLRMSSDELPKMESVLGR